MRKALVLTVWAIVIVAAGYHGAEMYSYVWNTGGGPLTESPSAVQQAAMAAYRTGMMVLFYIIGRGLTDTIKVTVPSDE
jgi:hypothetical protein